MVKKKQTGLATLALDTGIQDTAETQEQEAASIDRKSVIFRVLPATHKKLSILAIEEETSVQALMEHAIDLLFAEKGI